MDRANRGTGRRMVAAAALLACTGCAGGVPVSVPSGRGSTRAAPSPSPTVPPTTAAPSPGDLRTPATRSGPLSQRSFPRPGTLGAGWSYAVDPGDAEAGYLGNGTPALARNPDELVQAAVPLGCPRRAPLPVPTHALEVDYGYRATKVVALRMSFADVAHATRFYDARISDLGNCRGRDGGAGIGVLVRVLAHVDGTDGGAVLSDRTPHSDPWTELAVLDGADVVLLAAQVRPGTPPLTSTGAGTLAAAFRR